METGGFRGIERFGAASFAAAACARASLSQTIECRICWRFDVLSGNYLRHDAIYRRISFRLAHYL